MTLDATHYAIVANSASALTINLPVATTPPTPCFLWPKSDHSAHRFHPLTPPPGPPLSDKRMPVASAGKALDITGGGGGLMFAPMNTFPSSGNAGVGTTSPSQPLEVVGQIMANVAGGGSLSLKGTNASSQPMIYFERNGGPVWLAGLTNDANASFMFNNGYGGGNVMTMTPAGRVGIGTSGPDAKLEVLDTAGSLSIRAINSSVNGASIGVKSTDTGGREWALLANASGSGAAGTASIYDVAANVRAMTFTQNGNVGIGTTSPGAKLHVEGETFQNGGQRIKVSAATDGMTLDATHYAIVASSATALTINLPVATAHSGRIYIVKNKGSGVAKIVGTIDGNSNGLGLSKNESATLLSDGTDWLIV